MWAGGDGVTKYLYDVLGLYWDWKIQAPNMSEPRWPAPLKVISALSLDCFPLTAGAGSVRRWRGLSSLLAARGAMLDSLTGP